MLEFPFVSPTVVRPGFNSSTFHLTKTELTLVEFVQVGKVVFAETLKLAVYEITLIV
jgi:hypothetical protein